MPASVEGIVFGRLAEGKGFITREQLFSGLKQCQASGPSTQDSVTLKKILVQEEYLTQEQVEEIEEILLTVEREDPIQGYDIERRVQDTDFGVIYQASQLSLSRPVNILVVFELAVEDRQFIDEFDREARTLSGLNHRGIVQGIDIGEEEDFWYFVMEHVEGQSLSDYVEKHGPIDESEAVNVLLQTLKALRILEENGSEHGDIRPDHIMINQDGITKLTGFPLAMKDRWLQELEAGVLPANLHYLAPEYTKNGTLNLRTDLYALGTSLYYAVTGHEPFQGMDAAEIVERHSASHPAKPVLLDRPEINSGLSAIIGKMMLPDPQYRYRDPQEVIEDVELISEGKTPEHVNVNDHLKQYQRVRNSSTERRPSYLGTVFNTLVEDTRIQVAVLLFALLLVVFSYLRFSPNEPVPTSDQAGEVVVNTSNETTEEDSTHEKSLSGTDSSPTDTSDEDDGTSSDTPFKSNEPTLKPDPGNTQKNIPSEKNAEQDQISKQREKSPDAEQVDPLRKEYLQLKESVDRFQGGMSELRELVSRIDDLIQRTEEKQLTSDLRQLRSQFLSTQAERSLDKRIKMEEVEQVDIGKLGKVYVALSSFPRIFRDTFTWNVVQKRKNVVREEIENRIQQLKEQLRQSINTASFSDSDQSFEKLQEINSSKQLSNFVTNWSTLRSRYLKSRSAYEQEMVREGLAALEEFKTKLRRIYDLSESSILNISDQDVTELINNYSTRAELDTIKRKIQMFAEDVNSIRLFRRMLKNNLQKMVQSGRSVEKLVDEPGSGGQLVGFSDAVLRVQTEDRTVEKPLSEYHISHRIALARWDRDELNKRETFALGLASFLGGDLQLAKLWLSAAKEKEVSRAQMYLDDIANRDRSEREQKVHELISSLQLARSEKLRYALSRIVFRLSLYDETRTYQQHSQLIQKARAEMSYQPESFLDTETHREEQKQLERILNVYRAWLEGRVERGTDHKSLQITYDFRNSVELTDWDRTNPNGLTSHYLKNKQAVRLVGDGMFLHDGSLTGPMRIQVEMLDPKPILDTGIVLMWRQNRGYRAMINWTPLGRSTRYPAMGSTVIQKFQLPGSGSPGFSNTRLRTIESLSNEKNSSQPRTEFGTEYRNGGLTLSMDGRDVLTASDKQFERGRAGVIFEGVERVITRIQLSGIPDREWMDRKLESLGTTMDQVISKQKSSEGKTGGSTSGQEKRKNRSSPGGGDQSTDAGSSGEKNASDPEQKTDGPLQFHEVQPGEVAFAVNFGGEEITMDGQTFVQDPFPDRGRDSKVGTVSTKSRGSVPESLENIYRSQRFGSDVAFNFPLSSGTYEVQFFLVEDWWNERGARVFDIYLEGKKVIEQLDIYEITGARNKGLKRVIEEVPVRDRQLNLGMKASSDNVNIAGILIRRIE